MSVWLKKLVGNQIMIKIDSFELKEISAPLYGLVLSGGLSSRMKRDKGEIQYHGTSQVEHTFDLLKKNCSEVFISCRADQKELFHLSKLPQIHDLYLNGGSLGGILSAMNAHRHAAWLVLACDLPLVDEEVVSTLLNERDELLSATAFYNLDEKRFEPLASIYEPKSYEMMLSFLNEGKTCPQKVLFNSEVKIINLKNGDWMEKKLSNVNTPEESAIVTNKIREK